MTTARLTCSGYPARTGNHAPRAPSRILARPGHGTSGRVARVLGTAVPTPAVRTSGVCNSVVQVGPAHGKSVEAFVTRRPTARAKDPFQYPPSKVKHYGKTSEPDQGFERRRDKVFCSSHEFDPSILPISSGCPDLRRSFVRQRTSRENSGHGILAGLNRIEKYRLWIDRTKVFRPCKRASDAERNDAR